MSFAASQVEAVSLEETSSPRPSRIRMFGFCRKKHLKLIMPYYAIWSLLDVFLDDRPSDFGSLDETCAKRDEQQHAVENRAHGCIGSEL